MIDKSSLLKSQGSLYLKFIPKDGLFHKMLLLSLMGFLTGSGNLGIGLRAAIMAQGRRRGSLWVPKGQYLGHATTSNH